MKQKDFRKLYDDDLKDIKRSLSAEVQGKSGKWHDARPEMWQGGILFKLCKAWDVLTGKADALYWTIDLDK